MKNPEEFFLSTGELHTHKIESYCSKTLFRLDASYTFPCWIPFVRHGAFSIKSFNQWLGNLIRPLDREEHRALNDCLLIMSN